MNVRQVVPRDAIPSVDDPEFGEEYDGDPGDEVVVLDGDPPRAYPIRYLNYHEIVNDRVEGRPVVVTWCPLCGSAVAYDARVGDRDLEFGVSGKLADDDLVMYDRETGSEWKQSLGEAIAGPLEGSELRVLPAATTTYRQFREEHPGGVVLQTPGGKSEASGAGSDPEPIEYADDPYRDYFEAEGFGLGAHRGRDGRDWPREDIDPKDVVLGVDGDGEVLGFPLDRVVAAGGVVTATVGDRDVVVFATPDGIFAYEDPGHDYEPVDGSEGGDDRLSSRFRADGATWDGATGESEDGRGLDRIPARRLFAFAWQDDHGPDAFYGDGE